VGRCKHRARRHEKADMSNRKKVAILGGGMAALTAAYYLSRTESLRARYEVTVYQIGWRLGGKAATGRREGRIEEHGLHIWFGYYDNAFRLLREVYRDWSRDAKHPLQSWRDALQPQSFTPIGPQFFPLFWPTNDAVPGDGHLCWTPWQAFSQALGVIAAMLQTWHEARERAGQAHPSPIAVSHRVLGHLQQAQAGVDLQARGFAHSHQAVAAAAGWAQALGDSHHGPLQHHLPSIAELLAQTHNGFLASLPAEDRAADLDIVAGALDVLQGFARGFVDDLLIAGKTARELDALEFRDWLVGHGTTRSVADGSVVVQALYDTMFQYEEGDLRRPSYAAGTAVQVILRMFGCAKGAALWEMQAGMGEVVVAPLYKLLKSRGVAFEFFREVRHIGLDGSRSRVAHIDLTCQAKTIAGPYRPTFEQGGLDCWPAEPFWDQLQHGSRLRQAGIDFESPWSAHEPAGHQRLRLGTDFDEVVLGISLGAFKRLNADPTLADELSAANPAFAAMTDKLGLVPSLALQAWSVRTLEGLGWTLPKPAAVSGVQPLDIWADMSQTLRYEAWDGARAPKSVHYFTGVLHSNAYRQPRSAQATQHEADAALARLCEGWLAAQGPRIWPAARKPSGAFDWAVLHADAGQKGPARLDAQFIRANVSPSECCVGSAAGTTRWRLQAQHSGFANLKLAGCWIDTGFNTTCIEAAVMSGMQAARAICGEPLHVIGEDLLQTPHHGLGMVPAPLRALEQIGEFVEEGVERVARWLLGARKPDGKQP